MRREFENCRRLAYGRNHIEIAQQYSIGEHWNRWNSRSYAVVEAESSRLSSALAGIIFYGGVDHV